MFVLLSCLLAFGYLCSLQHSTFHAYLASIPFLWPVHQFLSGLLGHSGLGIYAQIAIVVVMLYAMFLLACGHCFGDCASLLSSQAPAYTGGCTN